MKAPAREWNRIEREVVGKLQAFGLGEDATPMLLGKMGALENTAPTKLA